MIKEAGVEIVIREDAKEAIGNLDLSDASKNHVIGVIDEKREQRVGWMTLVVAIDAAMVLDGRKKSRSGSYLIPFFDALEAVVENSNDMIPLAIRWLGIPSSVTLVKDRAVRD